MSTHALAVGWQRSAVLVSALLTFAAPSAHADVAFQAALDKDEVAVGQSLTLVVEATWREDDGAWQVLGVSMPKPKGLEVVGSDSKGESLPEGATVRHRRVFRYVLKATEAGEAETGPIEVAYAPPRKPEGADADKLTHTIPSKKVRVAARHGFGRVEWAVAGGAAFVFLAVLAIWLIDRSKKRQAALDAASRPPSDQLARDSLAKINDLKPLLIEGELKTYCGRLLDILEGYLSAKYGSSVDEAKLGRELSAKLVEIRETCEAIRFAGHSPGPGELDRLTARVADLIRANLPLEAQSSVDGVISDQ